MTDTPQPPVSGNPRGVYLQISGRANFGFELSGPVDLPDLILLHSYLGRVIDAQWAKVLALKQPAPEPAGAPNGPVSDPLGPLRGLSPPQ